MLDQTTPYKKQYLQLILHNDHESCLVGEMIQPKLQIVNTSDMPVEMNENFIFDDNSLAFSSPNAFYLEDPDGVDLLIKYKKSKPFTYGQPVRVEANNEEWLYLPLSLYFRLRKPGLYTMWIELSDQFGKTHTSNHIQFSLIDIESSIPFEDIFLSIQSINSKFGSGEQIEIDALFTNRSHETIILLRPQEDSLDTNINPMYQFTVVDEEGCILPFPQRCGTMEKPVYDETAMVTLRPEKTWIVTLLLPKFIGLHYPGKYKIYLTYIVGDFRIGYEHSSLNKIPPHLNKNILRSVLTSNELEIQVI